ncbi:Kiwa anti-phage protein KwaB-like domain-containing protein [Nocardioides sp. GY 10127]|uniref:Kiwa anti-phage protein KwaB-like domain-containing protein n=1 Tax=Nocardioides sp. GY 10127 TaxID=2569762 RepID=UPI0014584E3B|nr:Kiwa anti-phage protein KwaB-like domain-containing protein [Nocardioides sp. GY 10127]
MLKGLPDLAAVGLNFTAVGADPTTGSLTGWRVNLTPDLAGEIAGFAQKTRVRLEEAGLLPYGPATLVPLQHWMYVSEAEAGTLELTEQVVRMQDLLPFTEKTSGAVNLTMVAARFNIPNEPPVTFYRIADSLLQMKKSIVGLVRVGGVYGKLESADVLLLKPVFDVVVIGGFAFFTKKPTFERAFGFLAELEKQSLRTFEAVTDKLEIEGMEDLRNACTSQPQMMAKMASIKRSMDADPDYAKAMTMENLIGYIEKHPHVKIEISGKGKNRKLVFDPKPTHRFQIVKLLDDDFLRSALTKREYEAGSKTQAG